MSDYMEGIKNLIEEVNDEYKVKDPEKFAYSIMDFLCDTFGVDKEKMKDVEFELIKKEEDSHYNSETKKINIEVYSKLYAYAEEVSHAIYSGENGSGAFVSEEDFNPDTMSLDEEKHELLFNDMLANEFVGAFGRYYLEDVFEGEMGASFNNRKKFKEEFEYIVSLEKPMERKKELLNELMKSKINGQFISKEKFDEFCKYIKREQFEFFCEYILVEDDELMFKGVKTIVNEDDLFIEVREAHITAEFACDIFYNKIKEKNENVFKLKRNEIYEKYIQPVVEELKKIDEFDENLAREHILKKANNPF